MGIISYILTGFCGPCPSPWSADLAKFLLSVYGVAIVCILLFDGLLFYGYLKKQRSTEVMKGPKLNRKLLRILAGRPGKRLRRKWTTFNQKPIKVLPTSKLKYKEHIEKCQIGEHGMTDGDTKSLRTLYIKRRTGTNSCNSKEETNSRYISENYLPKYCPGGLPHVTEDLTDISADPAFEDLMQYDGISDFLFLRNLENAKRAAGIGDA